MKKSLLLITIGILFGLSIQANNIQVNNLSVTGQNYFQHTCLVQFDLNWENSWRNDSSPPFNWDAAWVFIKFKNLSNLWQHATLDTTGHIAPSGVTIKPSSDGTGVFIYRAEEGSGNVNWTDVRLKWNYGEDGVPDDAAMDIGVYAIEMVYIPGGNFYLGDGNGEDESFHAFHLKNGDTLAAYITNTMSRLSSGNGNTGDFLLQISSGVGVDGDNGVEYTTDTIIDNPYYPIGYKAYYVMKYEMSQEQYRDFLNSLTRVQQNRRTMTNLNTTVIDTLYVLSGTLTPQYNNGICCLQNVPATGPLQFYCELNNVSGNFDPDSVNDAQTFPCNFITWMDGCAYADWAGLRPMTEMEFEKACRGPNPPITREFAWGNTSINSTTYTFNHPERGWYDEMVTNPGINTGNAIIFQTGSLPVRCGEFAASSPNHTKAEAGSSYYGVMEMTSNLSEFSVCAGNMAGITFTGLHGNGKLNVQGDADVDYWPGINGNNDWAVPSAAYSGSTGVTDAAGSGLRGGCFLYDISNLPTVSDRGGAGWYNQPNTHTNQIGFRGVRTAP